MCDRMIHNENLAAEEAPAREGQPAEAFYQLIEQYHCPRCEGAIRQDAIQSKLLGPTAGMIGTRKSVIVFCDHCNEMFSARFTLLGGIWQIEDRPAVVTRKSVRDAFMERIEATRGDRQQTVAAV